MDFNKAINIILKWEGGYVNHPKDPGGETKYGITKRSYPYLDIKNLKLEDAKTIYFKDYWAKNRIEMLAEDIRLPVFDACVNQGPSRTVKTLQRILQVDDDGVIGPITAGASKKWRDKRDLTYRFLKARLDHYMSLGTFQTFGKGWTRRLLDIAVQNEYNKYLT